MGGGGERYKYDVARVRKGEELKKSIEQIVLDGGGFSRFQEKPGKKATWKKKSSNKTPMQVLSQKRLGRALKGEKKKRVEGETRKLGNKPRVFVCERKGHGVERVAEEKRVTAERQFIRKGGKGNCLFVTEKREALVDAGKGLSSQQPLWGEAGEREKEADGRKKGSVQPPSVINHLICEKFREGETKQRGEGDFAMPP